MTELEKFKSKIDQTNVEGCWPWTGSKDKDGYGLFHPSSKTNTIRAHRYSYQVFNGMIPEGKMVLHKCDNPPCVNPYHLFLGTCLDNHKDMDNKNRRVIHTRSWTHCPKGHEYTKQNTIIRKNGHKYCRSCRNARERKYYHDRKRT